jgi:hypothetical protein
MPTHPHWVTPDDLWRDRLAVLADQGAWGAAWGVRGRASRTAGCPLPCCRKAKRAARTPICCGVQPCGSAPMMTAGAGPRTSHDRGAGMTSNNPPLPARGRGGANHPHLGSNPVAVRIECPNIPDVTLPLPMLPTQRPLPGCCGSDLGCAAPAARRAPCPGITADNSGGSVPPPSIPCHRRVVDAKSWSGIPRWLVPFLREVHEKRRVILVKS